MLITLLSKDIIRQRLMNIGMTDDGIDSTVEYLADVAGKEIKVTSDRYYFIAENGAMIHPVCFDLSTIKM